VSRDKRAPQVSVVIPTFNRAALLRDAITSALEQSVTNIEILVSDNGSTDDTASVVASFGDPRLQYWPLESNIGMIANLDRCLTLGRAPYLMILHDDDVMLRGNIEAKLAVAAKHPDVAFVHSAFSLIDADGRVTQDSMSFGLPIDPVETSETFIRRVFTVGSRVSPSGTLIRRGAIGDVHHEVADKAANDMGLWLRIARYGSVGYVDAPLIALRRHAASLTVSSGVSTMSDGDEYAPTFKTVTEMRVVMSRFASQFAGDPVSGRELRVRARRSTRSQLAAVIRHEAGPNPRRSDLVRLLRTGCRIEPTLPFCADGVELVAATIGGPSAAKLVHRARPGLRSVRSRVRSS
jgi:hypothetical protein